jgi:hypothetical protein
MALSVSAVAAKPASPSTKHSALSAFLPSKIQLFRDGGTIKLEGMLNKSVTGTVRLDGRIGSPTRGQLFVTTRHFLNGANPERKLTKADLEGLQSAVKRYVKEHPSHSPVYDQLLSRLATALKPAAIAPNLKHSELKDVRLRWSPGQGARPLPGMPIRRMGLFVSADVKKGHKLHIDSVKMNSAQKTVTVEVDARGLGTPASGTENQELFVRGGFSLKAERWTVVVKDGGKEVSRRQMMLGGPPAP